MASTSAEGQVWTKQGQEKRTAVQRMFAEVAPTYDKANGLLSLNQHHRWRATAVSMLSLSPGDSVLDVCCGTGDFMSAIAKSVGTSGRVVGADFCLPMLEARKNQVAALPVIQADACRLPVASGQFDAVTIGWGLRNVPDLDAALREVVRVLKPGGRFVSIDMAVPPNRAIAFLGRLGANILLPVVGMLFRKAQAYKYLVRSTERFATREEQVDRMKSVGLADIRWQDLMFGSVCVHFGRKP